MIEKSKEIINKIPQIDLNKNKSHEKHNTENLKPTITDQQNIIKDKRCLQFKETFNEKSAKYRGLCRLRDHMISVISPGYISTVSDYFDELLKKEQLDINKEHQTESSIYTNGTSSNGTAKNRIMKIYPELSKKPTVPKLTTKDVSVNENLDTEIKRSKTIEKLAENLVILKQLRYYYRKVSDLKNVTNEEEAQEALSETLEDTSKEKIIEKIVNKSSLTNNTNSSKKSYDINMIIKKCLGLLMMQIGFEKTGSESLSLLCDIYKKHLKNTTVTYNLIKNNKMSDRRRLENAIKLNGIEKGYEDLVKYMNEGIIQREDRYKNILQRIEKQFYKLLKQPCYTNSQNEEDIDIDKSEHVFVGGGFEEFTGEDFFGFKELGLEKELGGTNLKTLNTLLFKKKSMENINKQSELNSLQTVEKQSISQFPKITNIETQVIGLLKPFYLNKLSEDPHLIEDDVKSIKIKGKPKNPPIGKNAMEVRKRIARQIAFNDSKKIKRNFEDIK